MGISTPSLPLLRLRVDIELLEPVRSHFCHGGMLMPVLCAALQEHPLPPGVVPFASESGRTAFETGERYRFGVTLIGEAIGLRNRLVQGLGRAHRKERQGGGIGRYRLARAEELPARDLGAEAAALAALDRLTLRFVSPLRLERPASLREPGRSFVDGSCFPVGHWLERLFNRVFHLSAGRYPRPAERPETGSPQVVGAPRLLWVDLPVPSEAQGRTRGYTLGGVLGRVQVAGIAPDWAALVALGQYVHAGEHTHFGLGRYVVGELHGAPGDELAPASSVLERASRAAALEGALGHVRERSVLAGVDGVTPEGFAAGGPENVDRLGQAMRDGTYSPEPLLGLVLPKAPRSLRGLAVPAVRDRVAQRAVAMELAPAIDTLLEDCSFAYRKGFSRHGAARAIERAYAEGFRYVLDADIEAFFDAVDWERMEAKLDALYPFEPALGLVHDWLRSPVVFEGRRIERDRGLPQGSPLSPLLANLFLDELDEELLGQDYRLVRYADDFVVLCRDLASAQAAREGARTALSRLGLKLNETKTEVHAVDQGFNYLGYLFCRSVVVESPARLREDAGNGSDAPPAAATSWLAQLPLEQVRQLAASPGRRNKASRVCVVPLAVPASSPPGRRPLYVLTSGSAVRRRGEALVVEAPGRQTRVFAVRELSQVVIAGHARVSLASVLYLVGEGVPVFFCRSSGQLYSVLGPHEPDWRVWAAQGRASEDEALRVAFAREVVQAKLHNFAALVVRLGLDRDGVATQIRELRDGATNKTTLDALRGVEGRGAALYFGALGASLPPEWGFAARRAHPSPDPVNAMLSLGYTVLHNHAATALFQAGLNPRVGVFHSGRGAWQALASDLQEEFRHLVDAHAIGLIHRREVRPGDFQGGGDGAACLMNDEKRAVFVSHLERDRLSQRFTGPTGQESSYREFIGQQAVCLRDAVLAGSFAGYRALRVHG